MKARLPNLPLLLALFLSACATTRSRTAEQAAPPTQVKAAADKNALTDEAALSSILQSVKKSKSNYRISPTDLLKITVYREEDMDRTVRVSQDGFVSFPLAGKVKVGGLHVIEAEALLSDKLAEFFVDPQVTVFIQEYSNKQIYVLGEVKSPGSIDLPTESKMTVLEAISKAGGFSPVAAKDRTKVIRTTPDGKSISFTIEVSAITSKGEKDKDITLEPDDVIHIPQSFF